MPDQKMRELCVKISLEKDSAALLKMTEELIQLLHDEQATIKSRIKANITQTLGSRV